MVETSDILDPALDAAQQLARRVGERLAGVFLDPASVFSLMSLASALVIASAVLMLRGRRKWRHPKVLARALFPRWLLTSASSRADFGFFLLNVFAAGLLLGWALVSFSAVSAAVSDLMTRSVGPSLGLLDSASAPARVAVLSVAVFLAYDFSYWADHWFKHKIPALWEFHRVHHTAEVLSPLTAYRMHPVDSLIFANIVAVGTGATYALTSWLIDAPGEQTHLVYGNILLTMFVFATIHLQHSHIALSFKGIWGKIFFSPAHHHVHHSVDPRHYGCNLGSCLALWDLMFGTLRSPEGVGRLSFGAGPEPDGLSPHSAAGGLIAPFIRAARTLKPAGRPAPAA